MPFTQYVQVYLQKGSGDTFSVWKFRLGILDYLSRNPVFSGNFPFGKTKIVLPFTFQPKFPDLFGKTTIYGLQKQPTRFTPAACSVRPPKKPRKCECAAVSQATSWYTIYGYLCVCTVRTPKLEPGLCQSESICFGEKLTPET